MLYKVYRTVHFDKKLEAFSNNYKSQIDRIEDQLKENPYVGKPLGVRWFREKKLKKYRVYYLIYQDLMVVYLIRIGVKKDQQKVIKTIWHFVDKYREEVEKLVT